MLELIQQNPLTSLILFLIPIIGATWKVLDVLFVKPRDFRISMLEKNVEEMRKEFQRSSRIESAVPIDTGSPQTASAEPRRELIAVDVGGTTLLNDLDQFYAAWKNPSLTELQRDHFEKTYTGQKVIWRARLMSVSEEKNGFVWVSITSAKEQNYSIHVIAVFDLKHKESLLLLNKEEVVIVSGTIDSYFLAPVLKDCSIVRST